MNFILPNEINFAINILENAGFEAFVVGGCVRDMLLNKKPQDYDIATSATPEEIISLFPHTVPTGIKHGTVTVVFDEGQNTEITTFRTEGNYNDARHPNRVDYVKTVEEDLSRRDFTVNAIAYSASKGLKDPFNGITNLKNKVLKTVGNPNLRFSEDALRILRLFRFSSQLEFSIEESTFISALALSNALSKISRERIRDEFLKTLCGKNPSIIIKLLKTDCLRFLGIDKKCVNFEDIEKVPCNQFSRFAYFCFKNQLNPREIAQNLRCSKVFAKSSENICLLLKGEQPKNKTDIKKLLKTFPVDDFRHYLTIILSLFKIPLLESNFNEIIKNNEPYSLSQLSINGNDLQKLGITDKRIKLTLENLLDLVIKNPDINSKDELLKYVSK